MDQLLENIKNGEAWMTKEEHAITKAFVEGMHQTLADTGAVANPLLEIRLQDILISHLLARRLEQELCRKEYGGESKGESQEKRQPQNKESVQPSEDQETATAPSSPAPKRPGLTTLIEAIGKARERTRKAIKELEEHCAKRGAPMNIGLADYMKPIIEKAGGILDDLDTKQDFDPAPS